VWEDQERGRGSFEGETLFPLLFFIGRGKYCPAGKNVGKLLEIAHSCSRMKKGSCQIKSRLGLDEIGYGHNEQGD
jgi:hypothetical protein